VVPGRRECIVRRGNVARGEGRDSQRPVGEAWVEPAKLRRGLDGRVGRGPRRTRVPVVRQHDGLHE
jgi:hypothetical protein